MKKFWNWIKDSDETRTLRLEGPIDEESFWGDEITPQMFRDELNAGEGDVTVWINSPGGNVFAAAEIYTMLKDYKGSITVKIDAIAASAASVVAMAGDIVQMSPVAMLMIHDPSTVAMGNTKDKKSNKVKYGLKNCHYAKATFDEDGGVTYDTPVRIPGAVSLSLDANGEIEPFYADNIAYYVVNNNSGYEGDLEIALIPESFLTDIMHEELDGNGVLAENANAELEHFAFLFEFDGDQRHIRHVMYNCVASRPSIEGDTNEDSKEVKTDTLTLQATPLANGYVKAKTGTNTSDDVYNKWYEKVYEPQAEAASVTDPVEDEPQG